MAIQVTKRPFYYCFSGNPVHYELYSAAAAADPSIYFEVQVVFTSNTGASTTTQAFEYAAVGGYAEVNIQAIVEGFLEYSLPDFAGTEQDVRPALSAMGKAYILFREIASSGYMPSFDTSEQDYAVWVIKGGVSRFKYQGNNFFANYFNAGVPMTARPFLTWQKRGRLAAYNERIYLLYLLIDDVGQGQLAPDLFARVVYTDGTTAALSTNMPMTKNRLYYVPAGAAQWGFSQAKQIWYWEIWIRDAAIISETFRFYADNRHDNNDITLHYRNSLGGLDSVRLRGVVESNLEYDYQEQQRIQRPDYFNGHFFDPQKVITNNKELQTYRGDAGFLSKEEQDRLRDAFLRRETWWEQGGKWLPVNIVTKNLKQGTSEDSRWSLPLDFTLAHDGDSSYTPPSVNLGQGTFTSNVCLAYLSNPSATITNGPTGYKTVSVSFQEVDPENASTQIRWRVIKLSDGAVVIPWTQVGLISPVVFNVPVDDYYIWEGQSVCANAVYGKKTQLNIKTVDSAGTQNSRIVNHTNSGVYYAIYRNGTMIDSQFLGANSQNMFSCQTDSGVTIVVNLAFFSPSAATLTNGVVTVQGAISDAGLSTAVTFPSVNITSQGIIINVF